MSGFAAGGIMGGNIESAIQGALFGVANFGVGDAFTDIFANAAAHAIVGCAQQATAGGNCGGGALSGGFSALAGSVLPANYDNLLARAAIGAIASRLGGDTAQNGAVTAAFEYLFNQMSHPELGVADSRARAFIAIREQFGINNLSALSVPEIYTEGQKGQLIIQSEDGGPNRPVTARVYEGTNRAGQEFRIVDHWLGHRFEDGKTLAPHLNVEMKNESGKWESVGRNNGHYYYTPTSPFIHGRIGYRLSGGIRPLVVEMIRAQGWQY
jgi:hypothetical protein